MKWFWFKPRLSRAQKALMASKLGVPCLDVSRVRDIQREALHAGLLAGLSAEHQARIDRAFARAREALGSSQSQPVPGRHRAARTLKLSDHGGAK